jgi:hypothetical protein
MLDTASDCMGHKRTTPKPRNPGLLHNPAEFARLGNRSLKCFCRQCVIVGLGALAQDQIWSACRLGSKFQNGTAKKKPPSTMRAATRVVRSRGPLY